MNYIIDKDGRISFDPPLKGDVEVAEKEEEKQEQAKKPQEEEQKQQEQLRSQNNARSYSSHDGLISSVNGFKNSLQQQQQQQQQQYNGGSYSYSHSYGHRSRSPVGNSFGSGGHGSLINTASGYQQALGRF